MIDVDLVESEEEGLGSLSKSPASVPAAFVKPMPADIEDPLALAISISNKLQAAQHPNAFYLPSTTAAIHLDLEMLAAPLSTSIESPLYTPNRKATGTYEVYEI